MKPATYSKSAIWALLLIDPTRQLHTLRLPLTSSVDFIERLRSSWVCRMTMLLTSGPLAAPYTKCTLGKFYLQATVTTKCSRPSWRSVVNSVLSCTSEASCLIYILMRSETSSALNEIKCLERYVSFTSCVFHFTHCFETMVNALESRRPVFRYLASYFSTSDRVGLQASQYEQQSFHLPLISFMPMAFASISHPMF